MPIKTIMKLALKRERKGGCIYQITVMSTEGRTFRRNVH